MKYSTEMIRIVATHNFNCLFEMLYVARVNAAESERTVYMKNEYREAFQSRNLNQESTSRKKNITSTQY